MSPRTRNKSSSFETEEGSHGTFLRSSRGLRHESRGSPRQESVWSGALRRPFETTTIELIELLGLEEKFAWALRLFWGAE